MGFGMSHGVVPGMSALLDDSLPAMRTMPLLGSLHEVYLLKLQLDEVGCLGLPSLAAAKYPASRPSQINKSRQGQILSAKITVLPDPQSGS
jgi:hypothetical protein